MMNIIKTDTKDQNHHNKHLFNILKENQIKKIIKKHLIAINAKETAIEVIPLEDQDKILEIIQKTIDIIQDQIQDQDILNTQIDLIVHTNQDQDMIPIKIKIEITVKIITLRSPYRNYNSNYNSQSPYRTYSRQRFRSRSQTPNSNFNRYNNPYRPPSRPRKDYNRSRSSSFTRQNPQRINKIEHKEKSHKNTNFELNMYHPTETANAITPTSWFYQLYVSYPTSKVRHMFSKIRNFISFRHRRIYLCFKFTNIHNINKTS